MHRVSSWFMYTLLWEKPKRLIPRVGRAEAIQQGNWTVTLPFFVFHELDVMTWQSTRQFEEVQGQYNSWLSDIAVVNEPRREMDHQARILPNFLGLTLLFPCTGWLLACQIHLVFMGIPLLLEHMPWFSQTDRKGQFFVGTSNIFILQDREGTTYWLELLAFHFSTPPTLPKAKIHLSAVLLFLLL